MAQGAGWWVGKLVGEMTEIIGRGRSGWLGARGVVGELGHCGERMATLLRRLRWALAYTARAGMTDRG